MKTLTIFTPAYNRAYTLPRTYKSLCRQSCHDFEWLIIDDGSTDNTKTLVEQWQQENKIPIRYIYQENQGMHGAHNTAYRNINTELNTCIDSDDWMPDDAVEKIIQFWKTKGSNNYAGIIGLDAYESEKIVGSPFPDNLTETTLRNYHEVIKGRGDKKLVYRTEIIKNYPEYPIFAGEKYISLGYKYSLIDNDYNLLVTNQIFCYVEYQSDGSSNNMWKQYWNNPKGFAFIHKDDMLNCKTYKRRFIVCCHYVSHSIRSRNFNFIKESPLPILTSIVTPIGFLLFLYNWYKVKK